MRNLLAGLVLVIAGIFIAMTYDWARDHFVPSPASRAKATSGRARFPASDHLRQYALRRFAEYPAADRDRLRKNFRAATVSLDDWLAGLERSSWEILCVGEHHDDVTRNFLSRRFFGRFPLDVLMLEMREPDLEIVSRLVEAGSPRLSLLDADITGIIRSVGQANPDARIYAIEETRGQMLSRLDKKTGSREDSILKNFRAQFEPGKRNVVLYGALHCTDAPQWLFHRIRAEDGIANSLSVNVISANGSGGIEAFVNFAEDLGLSSPPFAIPRTGVLDRDFYYWFPPLAQLFQRYDAAVVFDPRTIDPRGPR